MNSGRDLDSLAPIVAGPVAWSSSGDGARPERISVDAGDRVIDVEGDEVAAVLSDCDGRTTVAELAARHGAEARELAAAMLEAGALVDGAEVWRVFHRQGSAGTALGTAASPETVAELQRRRFRPANAGDEVVPLAKPGGSVHELTIRRGSMSVETPVAIPDFERLSSLMTTLYSVREADASGNHKTGGNASAGALYPLIVHLVLRKPLGPLAAGVWWHDPFEQSLSRLDADPAAAEQLFLPEPNCERLLQRGGPLIFISAEVAGPSRKYGPRAYRYAMIEVGAAMQSVHLSATELGVPLRAIGGIHDDDAHEYLALPDSAVCALALIAG